MNRPIAFAILLALLATAPARAGDFIDTRLSFVFSDNNFLAGPGERPLNNPGIGIGADRSNTLFFDNYDTKYSGFETLSHLVLYTKAPSFFKGLETEASLVVRFLLIDEDQTKIFDAGSYLRLTYALGDASNLQLVLFPISGDRFRLGYSYKISWGGSSAFPLNAGFVPAMKLQLNLPRGYAFLGLKTTQIQENIAGTDQVEMVTNYGFLGGFGIDLWGFRAEVNGGAFTRGTLQSRDLRGEQLLGGGVSYQLGYHRGMEIGTSIDFKLYENDPDREMHFFKPEEYGEGLSLLIKHEGSFLMQNLADASRFATTTLQDAYAFDLNFALKWGFFRAHFDAMFRTLAFLLYDVPSFTPFQDFPERAEVAPEIFAALGIDYHFPGLHLTSGIKVGVQRPSTYTIDTLSVGSAVFSGKRTVVVRDVADRSILPLDEGASLIYSAKFNCKWDLSEAFAMVAEVYYTWDDNQVIYVSDVNGLNEVYAQFVDPHVLGLNLAAQARF